MTIDLSNAKQINKEFIKQCIVRTVGSTHESTMCNDPESIKSMFLKYQDQLTSDAINLVFTTRSYDRSSPYGNDFDLRLTQLFLDKAKDQLTAESINYVFTQAKYKDVSIAVFKAAKEQITTDSINHVFRNTGWGTKVTKLLFDQAEDQITGDSINYVLKDTSMDIEKVKLLFERAKDQFTDEAINEAFKNSSINAETLIFLFNQTKNRLTSDSIDYAFKHSRGTYIVDFLFDHAKEKIALDSIKEKSHIFYIYNDHVVGPKLQHWLSAIKILGQNETEVASKFKYDSQISALELLGKEKAELALKFTNDEQVKALKKLGIEMAEVSTKFYSMWQNSAIDILGKENAELALKFNTVEHNIVLKALGKENAAVALEIVPQIYWASRGNDGESHIYEALRLLKASDNIKTALEFTSDIKIKTLEIIGAKKADLALKIANEIEAKSRGHNDVKAHEILNNALTALEILKDSPNIKHTAKFINSNYYKIGLLEKCSDNLDCKNKCIDNEEFNTNYEDFYNCYSGISATNYSADEF